MYNNRGKRDIIIFLKFNNINLIQEIRNKKVICITTGKIFNNIMDASRYYGASNTTISKVCKGLKRYKTSGTLKDGTKLKWMFYDDFLNLSKHEQQNILENAIES